MPKQYAEAASYEAKLEKVMTRLGVENYNYNWDRFSSWVEFWYKNQLYRFDHSIDNAKAHGQDVRYGSDIFAQVVLSLEDIARMAERGIYELQTWIAGMKALPKPRDIPDCFKLLGYTEIPGGTGEVEKRFKALAKTAHPDAGGSNDQFIILQDAREKAIRYFEEVDKDGQN